MEPCWPRWDPAADSSNRPCRVRPASTNRFPARRAIRPSASKAWKNLPASRRRRNADLMGAVKADSATCDGDDTEAMHTQRRRGAPPKTPTCRASIVRMHPYAPTIPLNSTRQADYCLGGLGLWTRPSWHARLMGRRIDHIAVAVRGGGQAVVAIVTAMFAASGRAATTPTNWTAPFFNFGNFTSNPNKTVIGTSNVSDLTEHSSCLWSSGALGPAERPVRRHAMCAADATRRMGCGPSYEHMTAITPTTGKVQWTSSSPVATNIDYPNISQSRSRSRSRAVSSTHPHMTIWTRSRHRRERSCGHTRRSTTQSGDLASGGGEQNRLHARRIGEPPNGGAERDRQRVAVDI